MKDRYSIHILFLIPLLYTVLHITSFIYVSFLCSGSHLLSRTVSSTVSSAARVLTFVFGMGTGVAPGRIAAGIFFFPLSSGPVHYRFPASFILHYLHPCTSHSTAKQQHSPYFFP